MIKLYNDDCLDILKIITDGSIDCIVTDPPYRVTSRGSSGNTGGMFQKEINKSGKVFEYNDIEPHLYASEFYRVLKQGTHCYIMCNHINLINMLNCFTDAGFKFVKSLVWDKQNKINGRFYMSQFEYILLFRKGEQRAINNCGTADLISIPNKKHKNSQGNNIHDTEKPVDLMRILISNSTNINDTVLDPFMGSGSAGVACKQLNRKFIGIEIDNSYFNIAQTRINSNGIIINKNKKLLI